MTENKTTHLTSSSHPQSQYIPENEASSLAMMISQIRSSSSSLQHVPPIAYAYIGDAVYELYVRCYYLFPQQKMADHHHQVVQQVRAETQAQQLQTLQPILIKEELNWVRRGKNSVNKSPRRLPLNIYKEATGLETLLGYLYVTNIQRLHFLLSLLNF